MTTPRHIPIGINHISQGKGVPGHLLETGRV
jgi:hypothetical protein